MVKPEIIEFDDSITDKKDPNEIEIITKKGMEKISRVVMEEIKEEDIEMDQKEWFISEFKSYLISSGI